MPREFIIRKLNFKKLRFFSYCGCGSIIFDDTWHLMWIGAFAGKSIKASYNLLFQFLYFAFAKS